MKKIYLAICCLALSTPAFTQADHLTIKTFSAPDGKLIIGHYAENIYKITYQPNSYKTTENISDAVILKRPHMSGYPYQARVSGDTVFIDNRAVVTGIINTQLFKGFISPLQPGEKIFGGGERALPLNRRGYRLALYNNPWYGYGEGADNLNYSVPFITSSKGYGLFFDNPSKGYIDIGKTRPDVVEYGASSGEINVYIIFGDYPTILQSYHLLTGTQPLPPRWALGHFMSRFGYTSEAQVKEIYAKMKAADIPVDAVIFDLFWFGDSIKHTLGNLDWVNKKAWPNPKKMIADFKAEGVNTILVTEPFILEGTKNYSTAKPFLAVDSAGKPYTLTNFYFGRGGLVDIFRNDSKAYFRQFYKKQMLNGVEAWWSDLGEPENHPSNLYHNLKDNGYRRLFAADEVHNLYGHNWTRMLYDFYAQEYPDKRLFSLARSGFAGTQRYSIFPWTGDVSRSWSGLRAQLPVLLGMSMSGVPYVHSDAGGFAGGDGDPELYVRWLQMAAFTPVFRPHGTALFEKDTAAFSFPSEVALMKEPYRNYAKKAVQMRYGFLSYNYSLAYQQTRYGKPLMAPLYYSFPTDTIAATIQDQFMWGENMMVAPVLEKGVAVRKYYLPEGRWFRLDGFRFVNGTGWQTDSASLNEIPYFIREGSFIPFRSLVSGNTSSVNEKIIEIFYIPSSQPSQYELFFDDGTTKESIRKKEFEVVKFSSTGKKGNELTLNVASNNGMYKGKPSRRLLFFSVPVEAKPQEILVDKKQLRPDDTTSDLEEFISYSVMPNGMLNFTVMFTGKPVDIKISW